MDPVVANAKAVIERGSKSFATAAKLFDEETRHRAFMLYAWCRYCDDRIDGQELGFGQQSPEPAEQLRILGGLKSDTAAAMRGETMDDPVFVAFQRVFTVSAMPARYPMELLEGFAMDVSRHRYRTLDDTMLYCYHVAGVVGAMMATIMGVSDARVMSRAIDLGLAFQLTNIVRDVMEDAADGRCYLPETWLREAGVDPDPATFEGQEAGLARVTGRLLDEADRYYASAMHGIPHLPFRSAWAIAAARRVYRQIGVIVRRRGADAWRVRASAGKAAKLGMLCTSLLDAVAARALHRGDMGPERAGMWQRPDPPQNLAAD